MESRDDSVKGIHGGGKLLYLQPELSVFRRLDMRFPAASQDMLQL